MTEPMPDSALGYIPWTKSLCSNSKAYSDGVSNCNKVAKIACADCKLVKVGQPSLNRFQNLGALTLCQYCSEECRDNHRHIHTTDCQYHLCQGTWVPAFAMLSQQPRGPFRTLPEPHVQRLWANIPAYDVLRLSVNEGNTYGGDITVHFPRNTYPVPPY